MSKQRDKKFLVTGAAGFIGSWISRRLIEGGARVWTIDNLSTGFVENLHPEIKFIRGGCEEEKSIAQLKGQQFDAIFHIAGQSSGEISFDNPVYDLRANTESTLRLIDYGLKTGSTRFIYASTMSVYGAVPEEAISEEYTLRPVSFYGVGKIASENYMRLYEPKGLKPTALRFFTVYGPNQNLENLRQGMVSIFLAQLLFADKIVVKGPADRYRDFIYIDDIVNACIGAMENDQAIGKVYNVGTGTRTTVGELIDKLVQISGVRKDIVFQGRTEGDIKGIYADISLITKDLGYKPRTSLEVGLRKIIDWAKTQSVTIR